MSLFLITNCKKKAEITANTWNALFQDTRTYALLNNCQIIISNNFKKRKHYQFSSERFIIFGFGTFFTQNGFFEDCFDNQNDFFYLNQSDYDNIFGHFVFVIVDKKREMVQITTDKVGFLNVFYDKGKDYFTISNDLFQLGQLSDSLELSSLGVQQFVLNESTIGRETIFSAIKRLRFGGKIIVYNKSLTEVPFHEYKSEKISLGQYCSRIDKYFCGIAKYKGIIYSELSAGMDTRIMTALGRKQINNLQTITNTNRFDNGIDEINSKIIADRLGLRNVCINVENCSDNNDLQMIHYSQIGRNIIRAKKVIAVQKEKFSYCDLIIGGYGGEVIRSKYTSYKDSMDFINRYYKGLLQRSICSNHKSYLINILKEFDELYNLEFADSKCKKNNLLYGVDRMRIWGGSYLNIDLQFGDRLHPMMDWYLMSPVFSYDDIELKDAKLMTSLLSHYAPELNDIPFNAQVKLHHELAKPVKNKNKFYYVKKQIGKMFSSNQRRVISNLIDDLLFWNTNDYSEIYSYYDRGNFKKDFLEKIDIDLSKVEKYGNKDNITRLASMKIVWDEIKTTS